ncbi:hypothetical protein ACFQ3W_03970 [Paenibacillus puldeungensis]|uniref:Uncharacterized protein n=1 Tax=Paenibacillus puldeungensis TaxID=696536 RepID=A0ABW3RT51_9BACL
MPSWSDLENFLRHDGWVMVRQSVSKGTGEIGKGLFNRILKQQPPRLLQSYRYGWNIRGIVYIFQMHSRL